MQFIITEGESRPREYTVSQIIKVGIILLYYVYLMWNFNR